MTKLEQLKLELSKKKEILKDRKEHMLRLSEMIAELEDIIQKVEK